jgi:hypothetical protein
MWVVNVHLESSGGRVIAAESEITDDDGMSVAHRSLSGADCDGIGRALGVWASLVLETEVRHASARGEPEPPPPVNEPDTRPPAPWPAPAPVQQPSPEHDWYLHHGEKRDLEIGLGAFLMTGPGSMAVVGPTAYVVVEGGHGVFLRPAVLAGQTVDSRAIMAATRFDACLRMPGLYNEHRGMQLDACAGADLGFDIVGGPPSGTMGGTPGNQTLPYASLGPSLELRGELGSSLSATLRGVTGFNLFQNDVKDASGNDLQLMAWMGRVELDISWGLHER